MRSAVILAAGESRRMGKPKLLLRYHQQSLLAHAIITAKTVVDEVIVVVGAYAELYRAEARRLGVGARVVDNQGWQGGMGSSVRCGFSALSADSVAALIVLADQPFVSPQHLLALFAADAELTFSRYSDGNIGVPAVVQQSCYGRALALPDHSGAKALIDTQTPWASVALTEADSVDIDTLEDAARWLPAK